MLHRLYSSLPSFKTVRFREGLNVLLAEKAQTSDDRDTRNGAGKSSIIELVHYLLGGDWVNATDPVLAEHWFGLEFDFAGQRTIVMRRAKGGNGNRVFFQQTLNTEHWPIQPEGWKGQAKTLTVEDWNALLGHFMFSLPIEAESEQFRPKFRNLFAYFARNGVKEGAFLEPQSIHRYQRLWDQQVCIAYLLGLDWTIHQAHERIRATERLRKQIRDAIAEGEGAAPGALLPSSAQLMSRLVLAERRARELKGALDTFRVLDQYHAYEAEASALTQELADLADDNTVDRQLLADTEQALAAEAPADPPELARVYAEAGFLLPPQALRRFDEVKNFHESVMRNRRAYLTAELSAISSRIEERQRRQRDADIRRAQLLDVLRTSGALESFTALQEEYLRVQADVEHLRKQHEQARELDNYGRVVQIERAQLERRLATNFAEQSEQIRRAVEIFGDVSQKLYKQTAELTIVNQLRGAPIKIRIPRHDSEGVSSMQIFCFDVTLARICIERDLGPGFLLHDSHLFDGVDVRQFRHGLEYIATFAPTVNLQYITMMNTDEAAKLARNGFHVSRFAIEPRLSDEPAGGLFGLQFGSGEGRGAVRSTSARGRRH